MKKPSFKKHCWTPTKRFTSAILRKWWVVAATLILWMGWHTYPVWKYYSGKHPVGVTLVEPCALFGDTGVYTTRTADARRSALEQIMISQRALSSAAEKIQDIGFPVSPEKALSHMQLSPIQDSDLLYVGVDLPNKKEAIRAAEIIAASAVTAYNEYCASWFDSNKDILRQDMENSALAVDHAYARLESFKSKAGHIDAAESVELARLEADAAAKLHVYTLAKTDLVESELRAEQAENDVSPIILGHGTSRIPDWPEWRYVQPWLAELAWKGLGLGVALALAVHLLAFALFEPSKPVEQSAL